MVTSSSVTNPKRVRTRRIQNRIDTSAEWFRLDPILLAGEFGIEKETKRYKIGDGITKWSLLGYASVLIIGTPKITVSSTPPNDPELNEIWIDISGA